MEVVVAVRLVAGRLLAGAKRMAVSLLLLDAGRSLVAGCSRVTGRFKSLLLVLLLLLLLLLVVERLLHFRLARRAKLADRLVMVQMRRLLAAGGLLLRLLASGLAVRVARQVMVA